MASFCRASRGCTGRARGKLQDVAMLGAANVTEGEKQRGLLKKSIGLWEISRDEKP